jgi:sialic acid synthase SpsE
MKPGEILRKSDLTVQRPGTGISPTKITELSGRRVMQPIQPGAMLEWEMISNRSPALSDVA